MSHEVSTFGGVIDYRVIDTTPGKDNLYPFAPPIGWCGSNEEYVSLVRSRYNDLLHGQRISSIARFASKNKVEVVGPYSDLAISIIASINGLKMQSAPIEKQASIL